MIIAREKKKNNIAEYILYMFQIEDIIRANNLDINQIHSKIISQFEQPSDVIEEMRVWYSDLIEKMKNEKIEEKGHLSFLNDIIYQMESIHESLLKDTDELKYIETYNWAKPNIQAFKKRTNNPAAGDIETCFTALYGLLVLKLQNKDINKETAEAMSTFSNLLAVLSNKYKKGDHNS